MSGLVKRGGVWHIKKRIKGHGRLQETTGTSDLREAERYLVRRLEQLRQVLVYGDRPKVTFMEAAKKYIEEHPHLRSLDRTALAFDTLNPFIGGSYLEHIHDETLKPMVAARLRSESNPSGVSAATINRDCDALRRVLTLAARKWRHPNGMTYLATAPLISRLPHTKRPAYPLTWDEQRRFFQELPTHLQRMALFDVNTGLRDGELAALRWDWEVEVPELGCSVFVLPGEATKNGEERIVLLNRVARSVVEELRGGDSEYMFTYNGKPVDRMLNSAWKKARKRAALPWLRVHDLRHTFAHRLRAVDVTREDRKALLGHKDGDVTTGYSAEDCAHLLRCVEKLCDQSRGTVLRIRRRVQSGCSELTRGA